MAKGRNKNRHSNFLLTHTVSSVPTERPTGNPSWTLGKELDTLFRACSELSTRCNAPDVTVALAIDWDLHCWDLPLGVEVMTGSAGISGCSPSRVIITVGDLLYGDGDQTITDLRLGERDRSLFAGSSKRTRWRESDLSRLLRGILSRTSLLKYTRWASWHRSQVSRFLPRRPHLWQKVCLSLPLLRQVAWVWWGDILFQQRKQRSGRGSILGFLGMQRKLLNKSFLQEHPVRIKRWTASLFRTYPCTLISFNVDSILPSAITTTPC